jgi:hypothetical protein
VLLSSAKMMVPEPSYSATLNVPTQDIGNIESLLTMAVGPYMGLETQSNGMPPGISHLDPGL